MPASARSRAGFTLIELLVAISVLAIVAVLGWRGLDGIVRARVALSADMERTRGLQLAFAQLQSDCAHIASRSGIANRAHLLVAQDGLVLVRNVFADDQPSRVQVIAYRLKGGMLTRRESAATRELTELDTFWQAAANDTDAGQPVVLQTGVSALAMRTWAKGESGWRAVGAAAAGNAPGPAEMTGLEVALQLNDRPDRMVKVFLLGAV